MGVNVDFYLEKRTLIRVKYKGFWRFAFELKRAGILDVHIYVHLNWRILVCVGRTYTSICAVELTYWYTGHNTYVCAVELTHTGVLDVHMRVYVQLKWHTGILDITHMYVRFNWHILVCWTYIYEYMCTWTDILVYWTYTYVCAVELTHTGVLDVNIGLCVKLNWHTGIFDITHIVCAIELTHTGVLDVHIGVYVQLNWHTGIFDITHI